MVCSADTDTVGKGGIDNLLNTNTKLNVNCSNSTWPQLRSGSNYHWSWQKSKRMRCELKVCAATWQLAINRICITVSNEAIVEIS